MTIVNPVDLDTITLESGGHRSLDDGACVMEMVSYIAGEPWSDHPECACPVLTSFAMSWNDTLDDVTRQRLVPYIPRLVGTRSTPEVESIRSWMACDWLVRVFTPTWLRLAGLNDDAAALEGLAELTAGELVDAAMPVIEKARASASAAWAAAGAAAGDAARDAARDAAGAAAGAAAGDAAWDAARAAAGDAAGAAAWDAAGAAAWDAAGAAAWDAARAAAWDAAWAAAGDAAGDALAPTVLALQDQAFELLDRMIAATNEIA